VAEEVEEKTEFTVILADVPQEDQRHQAVRPSPISV
jgi:hypothetical protein